MLDPKTQAFVDEARRRMKEDCLRQYGDRPVGGEQYYDIIRTWLMAYYESFLFFNSLFGHTCRADINWCIQTWRIQFGPVFEETWIPDDSWRWWQ